VPSQGYFLVWADEETGQTRTNIDLHVDFKLGQGGERIVLYDPSGRQIDLVIFGAQNNNVSQGRWPNGGPAPYYFMPTPTPRASNQIPVANPVVVTPIVGPGNAVTLSWTSQPGTSYRVEYKDDLGAAKAVQLAAGALAKVLADDRQRLWGAFVWGEPIAGHPHAPRRIGPDPVDAQLTEEFEVGFEVVHSGFDSRFGTRARDVIPTPAPERPAARV